MKEYGYSSKGGGLCKRIAKWTMLPTDVDKALAKHGSCHCNLMRDDCYERPFKNKK